MPLDSGCAVEFTFDVRALPTKIGPIRFLRAPSPEPQEASPTDQLDMGCHPGLQFPRHPKR